MTIIHSNLPAIRLRFTIQSNQQTLYSAIGRLSHGRRVESPSDDPTGWFASASLKSEVTALNQAIVNTRRADQVVAVAVEAVSQIRAILSELRGLAVAFQNTDALSNAELESIQSDVDTSLRSIDRIVSTTSFQGKRLLDGTAGYLHDAREQPGIADAMVYRAIVGVDPRRVNIFVQSAATPASVQISNQAFDRPTNLPDVAVPTDPSSRATVSFGRGSELITVVASEPGPRFNDVTFQFRNRRSHGNQSPVASYDAAKGRVTVTYDSRSSLWNRTYDSVADAIDRLPEFSARVAEGDGGQVFASPRGRVSTGDTGGNSTVTTPAPPAVPEATGLLSELVIRVTGSEGTEAIRFAEGTTSEAFVAAVNQVSDRTGVRAVSEDGVRLVSSDAGSRAKVLLEVVQEGEPGSFDEHVLQWESVGQDARVAVNGQPATTRGNDLFYQARDLAFSAALTGELGNFQFAIRGGGLSFQLGPDVTSGGRESIGLPSLYVSQLGSSLGDLGELRSDRGLLSEDPGRAGEVIENADRDVTRLLSMLGGFRSSTLASNEVNLQGLVAQLSAAESAIADADVAAEVARLARAEILLQAGMRGLQIAHQTPALALKLIQSIN